MRPVGVIPAAGHARRLQSPTGSKEMISVGGRPLIDYLVERLRRANCRELRVVTRPDKQDIVEHTPEIGARIVEGTPRSLAESIALGIEGLEPPQAVLVGLPDTIWEPVDGCSRLLERLQGDVEVVLGLFESDEPERSDVVLTDETGSVESVHVKAAAPPGNVVWGCFAARAGALAGIDRYEEPGHHFARLAAERGSVQSVRFPGELIDVGTPESLERALAGR
jgi:glucose-1-phosphate thymidylyltransferase